MTSQKTFAVLLALVAVSSSHPTESRSMVLDIVLRKALEGLKPKLKDLEIEKQDFVLDIPEAKVNASFDKGLLKHLDEFVIAKLTTKIIPLKLTNLTLTLDEVKLTGRYFLDGMIKFPEMGGDIHIFGDGDAKIELKGIFFTIAADFIYEKGKFQIPPNGLHGFDVYLRESKIKLDKLLGGGEQGEMLNKMLSILIPELVRDYKAPLFEYAKEPIRNMINDYLAGNTIISELDVN